MGFVTDLDLKMESEKAENDDCECGTPNHLFEPNEDFDSEIDHSPTYLVCPNCGTFH